MGAVRTAIGKYGGSLKTVPAHELGALVIREVLERAHVDGTMVDEVILGEVRQSTEASNIARCAALEAGLPESVPGFTVNRLCASSMQAILSGCQEIWCDQLGVIVAGGTENMSRAPVFLRDARWGGNKMKLVDSNIEAGTTSAPASIYGMGLSMSKTAENVAERFHITKEQQDAFAVESQRRATAAIKAGYFKKEIVPVQVKEKKTSFVFDTDEFPRPGTTMEVLSRLIRDGWQRLRIKRRRRSCGAYVGAYGKRNRTFPTGSYCGYYHWSAESGDYGIRSCDRHTKDPGAYRNDH